MTADAGSEVPFLLSVCLWGMNDRVNHWSLLRLHAFRVAHDVLSHATAVKRFLQFANSCITGRDLQAHELTPEWQSRYSNSSVCTALARTCGIISISINASCWWSDE